MKMKLKKILFELTNNSRITTKDLGKRANVSQQSAHYLLNSLEERKVIKKYNTFFDTSRFGLINFLVLVRCNFFTAKEKDKMLSYLENQGTVTYIEDLSGSWDYVLNFSTPNISNFNKNFKDFIGSFAIDEFTVLPVIVKHIFERTYLKQTNPRDMIIFGDREKLDLGSKELQLCKILRKNARKKYIDIAQEMDINIKTVIKKKKNLEKKEVIKGYSLVIDYSQLPIKRRLLLVKLGNYNPELVTKIIQKCRQNKNIISLTKTVGEWDIVLEIERLAGEEFLNGFRESNQEIIDNYQLVNCKTIEKDDFLPESI